MTLYLLYIISIIRLLYKKHVHRAFTAGFDAPYNTFPSRTALLKQDALSHLSPSVYILLLVEPQDIPFFLQCLVLLIREAAMLKFWLLWCLVAFGVR